MLYYIYDFNGTKVATDSVICNIKASEPIPKPFFVPKSSSNLHCPQSNPQVIFLPPQRPARSSCFLNIIHTPSNFPALLVPGVKNASHLDAKQHRHLPCSPLRAIFFSQPLSRCKKCPTPGCTFKRLTFTLSMIYPQISLSKCQPKIDTRTQEHYLFHPVQKIVTILTTTRLPSTLSY